MIIYQRHLLGNDGNTDRPREDDNHNWYNLKVVTEYMVFGHEYILFLDGPGIDCPERNLIGKGDSNAIPLIEERTPG